jgi:hypothetical protein
VIKIPEFNKDDLGNIIGIKFKYNFTNQYPWEIPTHGDRTYIDANVGFSLKVDGTSLQGSIGPRVFYGNLKFDK